ncbi:MAG: tRNA (guanine-N1)-methyltransferase [Nitrosopumilaceae archaeon]
MQTDQLTKIVEITEGTTKLLVPEESLKINAPPRDPAFFNTNAKLNRDFSIIAYSSFLKNFKGPKIFFDSLAGLGARSIRVANEIKTVEKVLINDVNTRSIELAIKSSKLNNVQNCEFSENEACRFLSLHSKRGERGAIIDIDPFGSPSRYIDCGIRATIHGGVLSVTATDLQVLHGLFQNSCKRRYYGVPVRAEFGNEIALRLILGCINLVAQRLDVQCLPLFVQNYMHYYRVYVRVLVRSDSKDKMGFISYCKACGHRLIQQDQENSCEICKQKTEMAGPLWIGELYDGQFIDAMLEEYQKYNLDKRCKKILIKSRAEANMPATYFTLDKIASKMKSAPLGLEKALEKLRTTGYVASPTSLNPAGFRTNCKMDQIIRIFTN